MNLDKIFFERNQLAQDKVKTIVSKSLKGFDDGELYLEYLESENFSFDDGVLKNASLNTSQGFGLRAVQGETTAYSYNSDISEKSLKQALSTIGSISDQKRASSQTINLKENPGVYYQDFNPLEEYGFNNKIDLLKNIDQYLRNKNSLVKQVSLSLAGEWQAVQIIRPNSEIYSDIRPLVRLNISVIVEKSGKRERGSAGAGGRLPYQEYLNMRAWQAQADEALRQALVNLEGIPAPAGEMQVVLGSGWPGVLLHEAVGHGLEGDFNRKKVSVFSEMMGERIASPGVTVIDDGTMVGRRGSLNIDDEGTPTHRNVLIEDGILVGYMQDRLNARLMGVKPTGNGRRESYAYQPMPRMTNTYMMPGNHTRDEMIASVKNGVYAANFGGGQVDITSGKFVFSASEAYKIENGKITAPIKGATLIGNGPDVMQKITMIGNDMEIDPGVGTCGKNGQSVPVGVGQPSLLVSQLTVGGTEI